MNGFTTAFVFTSNAQGILKDAQFQLTIGLMVLLLGCGWLLLNLIRQKGGKHNSKQSGLATLLLIVWGIFWTSNYASYQTHFSQLYTELTRVYTTQQYHSAEGAVHVIHAHSLDERGGSDIVTIAGKEFRIAPGTITFSYQQSLAYGGVLAEGTYARVFYYPGSDSDYPNPIILRIDLRQ